MAKKKIVVLSGAGISAESGLRTFRDAGGLWEVASPQGWNKNQELVLEFYNQRRKQALECHPNEAHHYLKKLEEFFEVVIITQNVDNLHERAGSNHIIHLHGDLFQSKSTADENLIYEINGWELKKGDLCEKGSQLRPNIVWFGEMVPMMEPAIREALNADILIVVGTSLVVYPAASIVEYVPPAAQVFVIDPELPSISPKKNIEMLPIKATEGMKVVYEKLTKHSLPSNN